MLHSFTQFCYSKSCKGVIMNKINKGITINDDDQDWGSSGLDNYLSQSLISSPSVLDANLSLLDKEDNTRSSKVD